MMTTSSEQESCLTVERELDRLLSKFSTASQHSHGTLENVIDNIRSLRRELGDGTVEITPAQQAIVKECVQRMKETIQGISTQHRELHASVSKVGKAIDKNFTSDFSTIARKLDGDESKIATLNEVLCEHFLRQGRLDVADSLINEGKLLLSESAKIPFVEMHQIVSSLKEHNLEPALLWAERNQSSLNDMNSTLEFNLHKMKFLTILAHGSEHRWLALQYAKHFQHFTPRHTKDIQQMMGCFLFQARGLDNSPYAHLVSPTAWEQLCEQFSKAACMLLGLPVESPLSTTIDAGTKAIGPLLHITGIMMQRQLPQVSKEELPVEVDLGHESRFHSIFACPILRQHTSTNNPPMRLVCGHVISKDAMHKLSNGSKLKCPYCPMEQSISDAIKLHL